jgi:hypothetical protein
LQSTGFYDRVIIGYLYPIITRDFWGMECQMFLKFKVDIPVVPGKLVRKKRGGHTYIEYEYDRIYDPVKQYTYPKRAFYWQGGSG